MFNNFAEVLNPRIASRDADVNAWLSVQVSPFRAAASPSKNTSGEPEAMALGPCPGIGQLVGSVIRAACFSMFDALSTNEPALTLSDLPGQARWDNALNLNGLDAHCLKCGYLHCLSPTTPCTIPYT